MNILKLFHSGDGEGNSRKYSAEKLALIIGCPPAAVLTSMGFVPFVPLHYLCSMLGLAIFGITLVFQSTPKRAFLATGIFGTICHSLSLGWIMNVMTTFGEMPVLLAGGIIVLFGMYLTLLPALGVYAAVRLVPSNLFLRHLVLIPVFWSMSDVFYAWFLSGFPWDWLCYTQTDSILASFAPLLGGEGVTLLLLILTMSISLSVAKRNPVFLTAGIFIVVAAFVIRDLSFTIPLNPVKTTLIQGNIKTETKWRPENVIPIIETYYSLSEEAIDTDIMVWPESAVPAFENDLENPEHGLHIISEMHRYMKNHGVGFITGIQYYENSPLGFEDPEASHGLKFYNAMVAMGVMDARGTTDYELLHHNRYQKKHLVPVGEFIPYQVRQLAKSLGPIFNMPMNSFSPGAPEQQNIEVRGLNAASAICYEIIFGNELREQIKPHTNFIVTLSNDGWFTGTQGPVQHLNIARMRAMEFQKPVLRATNNGISAIIDRNGSIQNTLGENIAGHLSGIMTPNQGLTPFARYGRLPLYLIYILTSVFCLARLTNLLRLAGTAKILRKTPEDNPDSSTTSSGKSQDSVRPSGTRKALRQLEMMLRRLTNSDR